MKNKTHRSFIVLATISAVLLVPSAQAKFLWAKRIASNSSWPEGEPNIGLALDTYDNCYVTGFFDGTNDFGGVTLTNQSVSGSDMFVAKYNSTGTLQWVQQAGGTAVNYGRGIGVDTNGNVYVAGGYQGPANFGSTNLPATSGEEFFLAKYDNVGTLQWVQTSTGGSDDVYGIGLAVDGAGNFYALVTVDHLSNQATNITFGSTTVSIPANNGSPVMVLVKYDNTGVVKWAQLLDSSEETYAPEVAVDAAGNAYVHGIFVSDLTIGSSNLVGNAGIENLFVAKFDGAGNLAWVLAPQSQGGIAVSDGGVAVDPAGNVFVSGGFDGRLDFGSGIVLTNAGTNTEFDVVSYDGFVAKYNSSGAIQWALQAGGTNDGFYWDIGLDAQTNLYAAGYLSSEAAIAEYDETGTLQWAYSASVPPASPVSSAVSQCAVNSAGNCYLAGFYAGTAAFGTNILQPQGTWNFFLAKSAPPAPPTLGITLTNGLPQLSVTGDIGSLFSLQQSPIVAGTNTLWRNLTTLTLTNRPQLYLDTSVPNVTNRFYRIGPPAL